MSAKVCGCDGRYVCSQHIAEVVAKASQEYIATTHTRVPSPVVRTFNTGANRDTDTDKFDYEGFLSPLVLERYAAYMHKNRLLKDGSLRDSDNWQKGIPKNVYMKSAWRHLMEWWRLHRSVVTPTGRPLLEEAICGVLFNAMGYLHEVMRDGKGTPLV